MTFQNAIKKEIEDYRTHGDADKKGNKRWFAGVLFGLKHAVALHKENPAKVIIDVRGGVAYVRRCPKGVIVEIKDHDNEGG